MRSELPSYLSTIGRTKFAYLTWSEASSYVSLNCIDKLSTLVNQFHPANI